MADTLSIQQSLLEKEHAELSERITQETQRAERAEAAQRKSNRIAKLSLTATILALIFAILLVMFDDQIKEIGRSITGKTPVVKGTKSD